MFKARHNPNPKLTSALILDIMQKNSDKQMQPAHDFIKINIEGSAKNEELESAIEKAKLIKTELAEGAATKNRAGSLMNISLFQDHEGRDRSLVHP
jgi:hypothetical protein